MSKIIGGTIIGGVVVVGGILLAMSTTSIGQGHAGIVYSRSHGIEDKTLGQGWHLVGPLDRVTEYPVSTETVKVNKFSVQTKDGKPLEVSLSYDYANELDKLPAIYNKFKGQDADVIQSGWLQTRIKKSALNVFSSYSVLEVFQNQGKINAEIEKEFRNTVGKYGFVVDSVTLGAPTPDAQTAKAIQNVVNAQQKLEQLQIEKQQAVVAAQKKVEVAKGNAEKKRIEAEAEAKANETVNKSITDTLIKYKEAQTWNGQLPQVSSDATPLVTLK
ncbi:prohibitin family protein [Priestia megaterium]|uniref:prohibitin family protein n=1 Tax=Priestia megaterium TaxID=1404 RepID=UPI000BED53C5|nr:prohibitin family protein [Priestia megaterium]PED64002.1 hypothetical protein CON20_23855 [Priestia megaterium]